MKPPSRESSTNPPEREADDPILVRLLAVESLLLKQDQFLASGLLEQSMALADDVQRALDEVLCYQKRCGPATALSSKHRLVIGRILTLYRKLSLTGEVHRQEMLQRLGRFHSLTGAPNFTERPPRLENVSEADKKKHNGARIARTYG